MESGTWTNREGKLKHWYTAWWFVVLLLVNCRGGEVARPAPPHDRGVALRCSEGRSVDPPAEELEPTRELAANLGFHTSIDYFRDLAIRYPHSATARLRAGEAARYVGPEPDLAEAERQYRQALDLHQQGCRLAEGDLWMAQESLGLVLMRQGRFPEAQIWFRRSADRWPTIAQTQYNLACTYCRTGDSEACRQSFLRALEAAATGRTPDFVRVGGTAAQLADLSREDPDLALLREDPRFQTDIEPYVESSRPEASTTVDP